MLRFDSKLPPNQRLTGSLTVTVTKPPGEGVRLMAPPVCSATWGGDSERWARSARFSYAFGREQKPRFPHRALAQPAFANVQFATPGTFVIPEGHKDAYIGDRIVHVTADADSYYLGVPTDWPGNYTFEVKALDGDVDPVVAVYDASTGAKLGFDDDSGTGDDAKLTLTLEENHRYIVAVADDDGNDTGDVSLTVSGPGRSEPTLMNLDSNGRNTPKNVYLRSANNSWIFKMRAPSDSNGELTISASPTTATLDVDAVLFDADGNMLAYAVNAGVVETLSYSGVVAGGLYYLTVFPRDYATSGYFDLDVQFGLTSSVVAPIIAFDTEHTALGAATLSVESGALRISHLGTSRIDGVSVDLKELSRTATLGFGPAGFTLPGLGKLSFSAYGMVNDVPEQFLGGITLEWQNNKIALGILDLAPFGWLRLEVYNNNTLVGSVDVPASNTLGTLSGDVRLASVTIGDANPSMLEWVWRLDFAGRITLAPQAGGSFSGNRVRIVALNPPGSLQNLARLVVTGSNIDSLLVQEENAPRFQPRLRVERAGQRLNLKWDTRSAILQKAPTVSGPWTDVAEGTNRLEIMPDLPKEFFRLLQTQVVIPRRNVLLIIADDVGVDQMPVYVNYYNSNTRTDDDIAVDTSILPTYAPAIRRLADAGVTFVNACSSPTCSPTRAGLLTGRRSFRHGVYSPTRPNLPSTETTIAMVLGDSAYTSGLFGKWHLGDPSATPAGLGPLSFGWDRHYGVLGGEVQPSYYGWNKMEDTTAIGVVGDTHYATKENVDDALNWIGAQSGPWMATVAFNAPHWAQTSTGIKSFEMPPSAYRTRADDGGRGTYRSMLEYLDKEITRLLAGIDPLELEKTTIIFMGDNGTEGNVTVGDPPTTVTISYHFPAGKNKGSLYEGGVNVPLIIADGYAYLNNNQESPLTPGTIMPPRGRVDSPGRFETNLVQTMDLFATIAAIGSGDGTSGDDSVSLIPYLNSASASAQRTSVLAEARSGWSACGNTGWNIAVRNDTHKLHVTNYGSSSESYELYDLTNDRWETTNIWDPADASVRAVRDSLKAAINSQLGSYACP
jgi:arylsulfatase A-like enzyme